MDTETKIPLNKFIEKALADSEAGAFNFATFVAGLETYGVSIPGYLSPLYTELANTPPDKAEGLVKQLVKGVFEQEGVTRDERLPQLKDSSEIQSSLPARDIDPNRVQAIHDTQEAVGTINNKSRDQLTKENIEWRRSLANKYVDSLRKQRLAGKLTEEDFQLASASAESVIEKKTQDTIYARTREEAQKKLAERISQEETFAKFRQQAREAAVETLSRDVPVDPVWDYASVAIAETALNPTITNVGPVLDKYSTALNSDGSWNHEKINEISRAARIEETVQNPPLNVSGIPLTDAYTIKGTGIVNREATINHAFTASLRQTLTNDGLEKFTEKLGEDVVKSAPFQSFFERSRQAAIDRSGGSYRNIVSGFISTSSGPDHDSVDYLGSLYQSNPDATPTPEGLFVAKAHANTTNFHFDIGHSPFEWAITYGKNKASSKIVGGAAGAAAGASAKEIAKQLGIKFLTGLGLSAGTVELAAGPVGWVIYGATILLPMFWDSIKSGVGAAMSGVAAGGIGSVKAASGALSETVQSWLGTRGKNEDPLSANGWLFALILAVSPVIIGLFLTSTILQTQRNQFLPIGAEGGLPGDNPQAFIVSITATPAPGPIPSSISYTITISPLNPGDPLTINQIHVCFSVYGGKGTIACQDISPSQLTNGSYTFSVPVGPQFNNSVITATVTVNADTASQTGATGTASASTVIGKPATGCFVFGGAGQPDRYGHVSTNWGDTSKVLGAIGELAKSAQYMALVCSGGPITLYYSSADFGGGSTYDSNTIFLYHACVAGTQACMTYTMAHESGHIVDHRTGTFGTYNSLGLYTREGAIWTYPNCLSEHEDFAETMGDYVVWKYYNYGARRTSSGGACGPSHAGGLLNYPQEYPLHYQFAKSLFGIEY